MYYMFESCKSLVSLDLSNFGVDKVTYTDSMFLNCEKLEYISFGNVAVSESISTSNAFSGVTKNIVYCIEVADKVKEALLEVNGDCAQSDCSNNWKEKQLKLIEGSNTCIDDCNNDLEHRYQYENKCYETCPRGTKAVNNDEYICIEDLNYNPEESQSNINENNNNDVNSEYSNNNQNNVNIEANRNDNICHAKDFFQQKCKIDSKNVEERIKNGKIYK